MLAAQQAQDLAKEISPNTAAKNPQSFADQVSDLAGHADGLSNYLQDMSKGNQLVLDQVIIISKFIAEEESPLAKDQQTKSAAALGRLANELPAVANNVLKSPQDPKAKKTLEDKVKEIQKEIETAAEPVRVKLALQPTKPTPLGQPAPYRPPPHHQQSPNAPPYNSPPPHHQAPTPYQSPSHHQQSPNHPPHHIPPPGQSKPPVCVIFPIMLVFVIFIILIGRQEGIAPNSHTIGVSSSTRFSSTS